MPGHNKSSFFAWPGMAWAIVGCNFAPQWRQTKPLIHSRKGNDTSAETYGEPQTPAELSKSSTAFVAVKSQTASALFRTLRLPSLYGFPSRRCAGLQRTARQWRSKKNNAPARGGFLPLMIRGRRRQTESGPGLARTRYLLLQEPVRHRLRSAAPPFLNLPAQPSANRRRCPQ